ncbi:DUF6086 family protein [Spirillospora sp. NPDC047279]|uniref:DUF6086 family protein n=1 Tax=Spirillospora sp. NPDC047279 TaxID=3155478 RepID=UPI0033DDEB7F
MSQFFNAAGETLWNPSNGVASLFMRTAETLAPEAGTPTGIGPMENDECEIDLPAFTTFTGALVQRLERSGHPILHALMEGFVATALVLVERGGVPLPPATSGPRRDVHVGMEPPARRDWSELAARHARAMPR